MAKRWSIGIDINKCIGCWACVTMCRMENSVSRGLLWNRVVTALRGDFPQIELRYFPIQCQHCQNPPCMAACRPGAISKREDGVVLIDMEKCRGCYTLCSRACPYNVIVFNRPRAKAEKCTLCPHRIDAGRPPACVEACQTGALVFGDLADRRSPPARLAARKGSFRLLPEKKSRPSFRYRIAREGSREWLASTKW